MTISEAIHAVDTQRPNHYPFATKIQWLSRMDGMVFRFIISQASGGENIEFSGYDDNTPADTQLLIPEPFDEAYLRWMEAQIYYHNNEYEEYNNAIVLYNAAFERYAAYYAKTHVPVQRGRRFLF